jgi:hypothetical protein
MVGRRTSRDGVGGRVILRTDETTLSAYPFFELARAYLKPALELSALVLGIVNGLMLLKFYVRDKAKLTVEPIHPGTYQWWFRLPDGDFKGDPTRRYGFITYIAVTNSGLRKVQLGSWRLCVRTRLRKWHELKAFSMPEPSITVGEHLKLFPVLGQRGQYSTGDTTVESGGSTSGMVYYLYECYGGQGWDPLSSDGVIHGEFRIRDAFNKKAKCRVSFREQPLDSIRRFAPGIDKIDKDDFFPPSE